MEKKNGSGDINRRDFLKIGAAGAAASFAFGGLAGFVRAETNDGIVYRTLGRTGLKVTTLSFGAMLCPEYEVIRAGLDMGINYVDTARTYLHGRSEEIVGRAVKGIRDKIYIATKTHSTSGEAIIKDAETSLGLLGTDHVDLLQLHSLDTPERAFVPEVREACLKLKQQGKTRFLGVTTHTNQAEVIDGIIKDPVKLFDTVLVGYNMKSDPSVKQAIARANAAGLGVIAMKIQAAARGGDQAAVSIPPEQAAAALKWALQDTNVTNAIAGMKTLEHVKQMFPVMGSLRMTSADARIVERYSAAIDKEFCRLCAKCEATCPKGVKISVVNRALMYAQAYGEYGLGKETFGEAAHAGLCSTCDECTARCVNGLSIARKMADAGRLLA